MKALSDFIAIILFFATYKITNNIIAATIVAVVTGLLQAAYTFYTVKKLEPMQWVSLILVVVFGGLTIWLQDRTFIMLKTTLLSWSIAAVMLVMQLIGKNSLRLLLSKELTLPDDVWRKLAYAWIGFFAFLGALNLVIAYPFSIEREALWMNFKIYGYMPLVLIFSIAQGIYLVRHLPKETE